MLWITYCSCGCSRSQTIGSVYLTNSTRTMDTICWLGMSVTPKYLYADSYPSRWPSFALISSNQSVFARQSQLFRWNRLFHNASTLNTHRIRIAQRWATADENITSLNFHQRLQSDLCAETRRIFDSKLIPLHSIVIATTYFFLLLLIFSERFACADMFERRRVPNMNLDASANCHTLVLMLFNSRWIYTFNWIWKHYFGQFIHFE